MSTNNNNGQPAHVYAILGCGIFFFLAYWLSGYMYSIGLTKSDIVGPQALSWAQGFIMAGMLALNPTVSPAPSSLAPGSTATETTKTIATETVGLSESDANKLASAPVVK